MCKAVEDLCREAAEIAAIKKEQAKNRTIAFKLFKAGEPDEKIIDLLDITQEVLDGLRTEYQAG